MRFRRTAATAALVLVAGGVAAVLPAAPAAAEVNPTHIVRVTNEITAGPGVYTSVSVQCPAGMQVVSVGGTTSPLGNYLTSMRPSPNYDGGTVGAAMQFQGEVAILLDCAPAAELSGVIHELVVDHTTAPGFRDLVQRCPAGMYGFGGGGGFTNGSVQMMADLATADGTGWEYAGIPANHNDFTRLDLQCAPDTGLTFQTSVGTAGQGNNLIIARVTCPAPYRVLSGGEYIANPNGSPGTGVIVWSYGASDGSFWETAGTAPVGGKLVAVARCVRS